MSKFMSITCDTYYSFSCNLLGNPRFCIPWLMLEAIYS